jgi:hypothetical protein
MVEPPEGHWTAWTRDDWNRAFCFHYFVARGPDDSPVNRLVVTPTALARIAGEPGADPNAVQEAFLGTIRQSRTRFNYTLDEFRWRTSGASKSVDPPPFIAHLIFTCLVASSVDDDIVAEGNFRNRLAHLLGNPEGESYPLSSLPNLWFVLRAWLDARRTKKEPYRRLVLPDPGSATLIGYSLRLAFPSRKDELALAAIFDAEGFGEDPPVLAVVKLVGQQSYRFSPAFLEAYRHFRESFSKGSPRLFGDPFWTAVREAAAVDYHRQVTKENTGLQLVLLVNRENRADLYLAAEKKPRRSSGKVSYLPSEGTLDEYEFVVSVDVASRGDGFTWAVELLLNGALRNVIPAITRTPVSHVVQQGVLLFAPGETNVHRLATSRPSTGKVRALLREDLLDEFLAVLPAEARPAHRRSRHAGWPETSPFDAALLARFDKVRRGPLADARCLQPTIQPPTIHLSGGIRVSGGYLGIPSCMPWVSPSEPADTVVLQHRASDGTVNDAVELVPIREPANTFVFPPHGENITGAGTLVASHGKRIVARRRIEFQVGIVAPDYKLPNNSQDWMVEAGGPDVMPLAGTLSEATTKPIRRVSGGSSQSRLAVGESDVGRSASFALRPADFTSADPTPPYELSPEDERRQAEFVECCAGMACSKTGIPESEFIERVRAHFRLDEGSPLAWDIVRGWTEAGAFDRTVYLRWRGRKYFARTPQLVLWRERARVHGTLVGLVPSSTRNLVVAVAERLGAHPLPARTRSSWIPPALRWSADFADTFHAIVREAYLNEPRWLQPGSSCLSRIRDVGTTDHEEPLNYESAGFWDWHRHAFSLGRRTQTEGVGVEWLRRTDKPDRFRVWIDDGPFWTSTSRNWALLVAYSLAGRPPYSTTGAADLVRSTPGQVYLPLPAGRISFIRGLVSPGPCPDGRYAYTFSSTIERSEILSILWGADEVTAPNARARWLLALATHPGFAPHQTRLAVPPHVLACLPKAERPTETLRQVGIPVGLLPHLERALETTRSKAMK